MLSKPQVLPRPRVYWMARKSVREAIKRVFTHIILIAASVALGLPLYWMISTSLKTVQQQGAWPPVWIPRPFFWRNYARALEYMPYARYTFNTLTITVLSLAGTMLSCPPVAYGFARIRFAGRDPLFTALVATMMLPGIVTLIPTYLMFLKLGWLNTYLPLVVPAFFGSPFYIFLLRQYFRTFPEDLADAARIDGANELGILYRVFLPNAGPALAVVAIFSFQGTWNDFFGPLIYLNKEHLRTLAIGLYYYRAHEDLTDWGHMMAAATMMTLPMLVLFALFQRYFVQGVALTGIKG